VTSGRLLTESHSGGTLPGLSVKKPFNGDVQRGSVHIKNDSTALQSASLDYDTVGRVSMVTEAAYSASCAHPANSMSSKSVTFINTATTVPGCFGLARDVRVSPWPGKPE